MERDRLLRQSTEYVGEQSTTPVQLKAALGKQSDPAAFSLRKGIKPPAISPDSGWTNRNRWSNGTPFDVTRRVGNSNTTIKVRCAQIIPSCIIPVSRHTSRPCSSEEREWSSMIYEQVPHDTITISAAISFR